jgi:hypothetical protein
MAEAKPSVDSTSAPKRTRVTAENRYPIYDILQGLEVAKAVKEQGGDDCSPEQLGGFLRYTNTTGGGFVQRVASARAFGLIETISGRYRSTARAEAALYPITDADRDQALIDAFFAVPMYRTLYENFKGQRLPEELGLKNLLRTRFGVPVGYRNAQAVRILMQSAEQAGLFKVNNGQRTHFILPPIAAGKASTDQVKGSNGPNTDSGNGTGSGSGSGNGSGHGSGSPGVLPITTHGFMIDGLWQELPSGQEWNNAEFSQWLDLLTRAIRVHYHLPE